MKLLSPSALVVVVVASGVLVPMTADGQSAIPRSGQVAPTPPRPPPPSRAPAPPPPAPPGPKSAPAKVRVPANLLKLGDAEIIFVGGKNVTAGEVRRDLKAQILRAAPPATLVRVASRKATGQRQLPVTPDAAALLARSRRGEGKAPAVIDCTQQPPTILAIEGNVASGQQFTILGRCFGDKSGDVRLIGQFPGGNLHVSSDPLHPGVTFAHWDIGRIVVALPAVSGSPDQTIALSVVTDGEHRESSAKQATFVAARERVEVPARLWSPGTHFETMLNTADDTQVNIAASNPTKFDVTVNPACNLDNIEARASVGKVGAITGWADGPPNSASVLIAWTEQWTTTSYWYSAVDDVFACEVFDVTAWASCPVGIAP